MVTEESLSQLFSRFGQVKDVSIKKSTIEPDVGRQCGYGFVHFDVTTEGIQAAVGAAKALQDTTIEDVNYKSSISHNLSKMLHGEDSQSPIPNNYESPNSNIQAHIQQVSNPNPTISTYGHMQQQNVTSNVAVHSHHMPMHYSPAPDGPEYQMNSSYSTTVMDQNSSYGNFNQRGVTQNPIQNHGNFQHVNPSNANFNPHQNDPQQFRQQIYLAPHSNQLTMTAHSVPAVHTMHVAHGISVQPNNNGHENFVSMNPVSNDVPQPPMMPSTMHMVQSNSSASHPSGVVITGPNGNVTYPSGTHQTNTGYNMTASPGVINTVHQTGLNGMPSPNVQTMPMAPVLLLPHPSNNAIPMSPIPMGGFVPSSPPMSVHVITGPAPPPPGVPSWMPSPVMSPNINTMSTDSIRDEHVSYFNVGQLLHSPNPSSAVPGYIASPIMSSGSPLVAFTPLISTGYQTTDNQSAQTWETWNRANKSPAQNGRPSYPSNYVDNGAVNKSRHSPGSTASDLVGSPSVGNGSSSFNRDVLMSSAAAKNSKSASKSGVSARTMSNRVRMSLPDNNHRTSNKSELDDSYNSNDGHD